ncbi:MAG: hypothetical protein EBQ76_06385 [Betaproteobacteria bacterium]|nr:hypothetical protein [Betaproteobacteria bacterium]NBY14350.1 hypothetical protein [Betaproteobacteria bacterium]
MPSRCALFCVGGAVRDVLLGEATSDRDYLVVGASPQAMTSAGFRPVGKDFPVFLHPQTHAEFALARTERKSGVGYHGFTFHAGPEVTLEEDLSRRDLTINAMAVDEQGVLHDPTGGLNDLRAHALRHVSPAFREDPVRLLRLARFLARWPDFDIHPQTRDLCNEMVHLGEADALVAERVWQELVRGLSGRQPSRMLNFLDSVGAWEAVTGEPPSPSTLERVGIAIDRGRALNLSAEVLAGLLFAKAQSGALEHVLPRPAQDWRALIEGGCVERVGRLCEPQAKKRAGWPEELLELAHSADLFRRSERLSSLLTLSAALLDTDASAREALGQDLTELLAFGVGEVAKGAARAKAPVAEAVSEARLAFIRSRIG